MPKKRYKPEEIVAKLRQVNVYHRRAAALPMPSDRSASATLPTTAGQGFGGLKIGQIKRLKELEAENLRLRRAVSDLTLDKVILQEAARANEPCTLLFASSIAELFIPRGVPGVHRRGSARVDC